jgi:hypothetical protein
MDREESSAEQRLLAARVVRGVRRRAAFHEGVGALWSGGSRSGVDQPDEAEAARGAAIVEARAQGRGDPDWWG